MKENAHTPVLIKEVLKVLDPQKAHTYIDATYGAGGYARGIKEHADCTVIGFDRDPSIHPSDIEFHQAPFSQMDEFVKQPVDGVVFDFGVSSMQIDDGARGFSFQKEGPLDMRMSGEGQSAFDVINTFSEQDLADIIYTYGEEHNSYKIAKAIIKHRPIHTTLELSRLIEHIVPRHKIHPATKTFQAIRMFVNDELREIEKGLEASYRLIKQHGKIVTVSFHALEDRVVKNFIRQHSDIKMTHKIKPSRDEIRHNPRSRSAILRAMEKL